MHSARSSERAPAGGWPAHLALRFVRDGDVTRLRRDAGYGPLYVQKPFHAEPPCTHVYIVHPPGGIVGGDTLAIDITVEADAHALLTTPAATKVYRTIGRPATLEQRLTVRAGATLEWLPLETIAFSASQFESQTAIILEPGACFFAWEVVAFGRTAGNAPFVAGDVRQQVSIRQAGDGAPLLLERAALTGGSTRQHRPWGYGGRTVSASAWYAPADRALGAALVGMLGADAETLAVSVPDRVLTIRALDDDAEGCMRRLRNAWRCVRRLAMQRDAVEPRIWKT